MAPACGQTIRQINQMRMTDLDNYHFDFCSQLRSEATTRGVFEWFGWTGYSSSERPLY